MTPEGLVLPRRYTINTQTLKAGGFGTVQRVRDTFLDRDVMFKRMQAAENNNQLLREIQVLSQIRSRHIVDIYDVIKDSAGNVGGIVIEYLGGADGDALAALARSDLNEFVKILYQVSIALVDLHLKGVVHRDLKLANLKQSAAGIVKLFDFGISSNDDGYRTTANRGTFVYAPPELYRENAVISSPLDIYAFGICAWDLLSDNFPPSLLENPPQKNGPPPSIDTIAPTLAPKVVSVLDSCLEKDPSRRPTAKQIRDVLKSHLVMWEHKGLFVEAGRPVYELSSDKRGVRLRYEGLGELHISYDGVDFAINNIIGDIYINNRPIAVGDCLHEACIITFGASQYGNARRYVSFFSSHPEVIL